MGKGLKCWKKVKPGFYGIEKWESKKGEVVKIFEPKRFWKEQGYNFETEFETPERFVLKKFKKKSNAQKFINSYMKKHDKC